MGIEQLREMAAEANLGFVPAVFLNKCGPREPLAPEGLSTLVYSNNVHTLAALAAHTGLRSGPLEPPVGGDDHVGESDALQRADDAEARGDQLTVASWLISAALLSDSTERADNHLRLSARRLLGALDVAGAAVVCSCPEQWLFVGDWTYLLGRVAALQGNSANAIHLFDVAWNKVSTNESAAAAGSELGEPLGVLPEVASHALAVSLASGDSDSLALWVERSRPFQQGSAVSNDDVDTASRIRIASIVAGTHDYEATELRPCAPLDGALGEAVTAHLIGDVDRAIGLIDDDLVVAAQLGNVAHYTYACVWKSVFEHRRGEWADALRFAESAVAHGTGRAQAFAACGAICRATVIASSRPQQFDEAADSMREHVDRIADAVPILAARDQALAWHALLHCRFTAAIERARRWTGTPYESLAIFGGPPLAKIGSLAARLMGDDLAAVAICAPLTRSPDHGERTWASAVARTPGYQQGRKPRWEVDDTMMTALGYMGATGERVGTEHQDRIARLRDGGAEGLAHFLELLPGAIEAANTMRQVDQLSPRQREVLGAVLTGRTNRQVAQECSVSIKNVEFHLTAIYRQVGVSSRHELSAVVANARRIAGPDWMAEV